MSHEKHCSGTWQLATIFIFQTDQIIAGVQNCLCNSSSSSSIMRVSCFYSDHLSECNCSSNCCWSISRSHHDHDDDYQDVYYDPIRNALSSLPSSSFLPVDRVLLSPTDPYLWVMMAIMMMIIMTWCPCCPGGNLWLHDDVFILISTNFQSSTF